MMVEKNGTADKSANSIYLSKVFTHTMLSDCLEKFTIRVRNAKTKINLFAECNRCV